MTQQTQPDKPAHVSAVPIMESIQARKRPININNARYTILELIAKTVAGELYWAVNHGWRQGFEPEPNTVPQKYQPNEAGAGLIPPRLVDVQFMTLEGLVSCRLQFGFDSDFYLKARRKLADWEQDALEAYFAREPVQSTDKNPLERPNPQMWEKRNNGEPGWLYILPPDLSDAKYNKQLSAFVNLTLWLGILPKLEFMAAERKG
jgi:hypothetical protein